MSRSLGLPLSDIFAMDSAEFELYVAEYVRCPWDKFFKATEDTFDDAPDLGAFLREHNA